MATQANVLRVNSAAEQAAYRNAVAEMLTRILAENSRSDDAYTLVEIAEKVDISLGTISNAFNKRTDLSPTYLNRLATAYGSHHLDPFAALSGGRVVPRHPTDHKDVLVYLTRAAARVAAARDPDSPGGERETHKERFDMLPSLLDLQRELGALICAIEAEKAAA